MTENKSISTKPVMTGKSFRLIDFNPYDDKFNTTGEDSSSDNDDNDNSDIMDGKWKPSPPLQFIIQMFGINEHGETCCIFIKDYNPFFYVKVAQNWTNQNVTILYDEIREKLEKYNQKYIISAELVEYNKLYGFSGGQKTKFVKLIFANMMTFNRVKNMWYYQSSKGDGRDRKPKPFVSQNVILELYESKIPPLLRYFHINNISPSGWVFLPTKKMVVPSELTTSCKYEFICNCSDLIPQPKKETRTPYKICSFDIEASSSHGDFPVPIKTYKRLATNIIDSYIKQSLATVLKNETLEFFIKKAIVSAFGFDKMKGIDIVYPKVAIKTKGEILPLIEKIIHTSLNEILTTENNENSTIEKKKRLLTIESIFDKIREADMATGGQEEEDGCNEQENNGEEEIYVYKPLKSKVAVTANSTPSSQKTIKDIFTDPTLTRDGKIQLINEIFVYCLPELEGDKITFIGSTFVRYGEPEPYMNHCLVLNTCDSIPNTVIETVDTEYQILIKWSELIQRENPDIVIGYNIFGFDYEFMFRRAQENGCERQFLTLSRKQGEIAGNYNRTTMEYTLDNTKIVLATGEYDLKYPKMSGRIQIDLYAYFRRDFNLSSYKLDDVAGEFIGDSITGIEINENFNINNTTGTTLLYTNNVMGLHVGDFIHIELSKFTTDYFKEGAKFRVIEIRILTKEERECGVGGGGCNIIIINGIENDLKNNIKNIKWCMAKDDVTPQDIFRLTNGTSSDRAIVAKYCIQDCNIVHHLFNKLDVMTGYIEMSRICSVPISFLVLRGQGIKLTSFVAKKCRDKKTLMPDIEKKGIDDGYEGAIVLPPKCNMYMDNPVACVDYSSLYPSSMISQNYSHDSKVWTREYNLEGILVRETGEKDRNGNYIYDNLKGYEYIDIEFDTFEWRKKLTSKTAVKTKVGRKICRWAQLPNGNKSIMPSILEELLKARKETRNLIKTEKDIFMQNILDKRQLGYKVTANSLYGQCGSKTSTFYEQDVAASTTATGRMMITYAKRIIEDVYGDMIYATKLYGNVQCNAEYVYGDSVANYTPVYIRKGGIILDICKIEDLCIKYSNSKEWYSCLEPGKEDKEICEFTDIETWSEKGWTPLQRVIRHRLAPHKKIIRILTNNGIVDVTDDHSLILADGTTEISPKDLNLGTEILHYPLPITTIEYFTLEDQRIALKIQTNLKTNNQIVIFQRNQLKSAYICWIAESIGLTYTLNYELKDEGISNYIITIYSKKPLTKNEKKIKNIIKKMNVINYPPEEYVYDFTTANHHFSAGIGNIVVHNTDSVFFTFNLKDPCNGNESITGKKALEITIEIAQDVANLCTQFLKPPMELSYEKTLWPFCLLSKKRYFGKLFEYNPDKGKLKFMGLSLKRRDNCDLLKDVYGQMLNILLIPDLSLVNKMEKCIKYLNESLEELIEGRVSMDKLSITKSLSGYYKNPEQIAHAVLAERIGNREAGNKPKPGDRIKYIHIFSKSKTALQGERIETPEFIRQNGVKIDYSFYITNQLMKPLQQLFGLALEEILILISNPQTVAVFKHDIKVIKEQYGNDLEVYAKKKEKYCSDRIKRVIFEKYLIQIKNQREGVSQINKYFTISSSGKNI